MSTFNVRDRIVEFKRIPAAELTDNELNWRSHPDSQKGALKGLLKEIGIAGALLAYRSAKHGGRLTLLDGHARKEVYDGDWPVLITDLTDEEADLVLATYDPISHMAGQDTAQLAALLASVQTDDADVLALLQSLGDEAGIERAGDDSEVVPEDPGAEISRADELRETWRTEPGQLWVIPSRRQPGRAHRLICGDSTRTDVLSLLMDGAQADMIFTDPPYNVSYVGKTKDALTIENDTQDDAQFYAFLLRMYRALLEVTRPGGAIYVCHADTEGLNFRRAMCDAGWLLKQVVIWVKQHFVFGRQDYHWQHEPILYGWRPGEAHHWYNDRKQTTTWNFDRPARSTEHPTMKPVELINYALGNSSKPGDVVLDGFLGSGSTMVACEQTARLCYGAELDPRYTAVVLERVSKMGLSPKLAATHDVGSALIEMIGG